jgi:RNA 2',3'-cyclic 3'-phosphodiesterase
MYEQFSLLGPEPIEEPKNSLFFVIFPDAETAGRIAKLALHLRECHGLMGKILETERFHVSVLNLGEYAGLPVSIINKACEAAASMTVPPFELVFDCAKSFHGQKGNPFVMRGTEEASAAFTEFRQTLKQKLAMALIKTSSTPLHLTLLYDKKIITEEPIEAIRWTAQEFGLVYSEYGKTRYIPQGSWALRNPLI